MRELLSRNALLLIVVVGAVVRFSTLGIQGYWYDEYVTLHVVSKAPLEILKSIPVSESNPPLFYLVAGAWERVFGGGEVGFRSLSAVLGTATIPIVYAAGNTLSSRRTGLVAAALTATSPLLIWYSQEGRNYALLIFLSALSFLCFVRALQSRDSRWLWAWAIASGLALTTHYLSVALLIPEAVWLLWRRPGTRDDVAFSISAIATVGLALLPLAATQRGNVDWIAALDLGDRVFRLPEHFLVGLNVPWSLIPVLAAALVALAVLYGLARAGTSWCHAAWVAGGIGLSGVAITLAAAVVGLDYVISRNLLELWVPLAIALGATLGAPALYPVGRAVAVALCVGGLALAVWNAVTPDARRPDWKELASILGPPQQERVVVSQSGFSLPLFQYLNADPIESPEQRVTTSQLAVVEPRRVNDYSLGPCWWVGICGGTDRFDNPPRFEVPAGFDLVKKGSTSLFDYRLYHARTPVELRPPTPGVTGPRAAIEVPP